MSKTPVVEERPDIARANPTERLSQADTSPLLRMRAALGRHSFFKLILGGSFTEPHKSRRLTEIYAHAGVDCLDIAPDPAVLAAVEAVLSDLPDSQRPVLMVSLPLDPDPHFRKIDLAEPDCIRCSACLPVCPTNAITLPDALAIDQQLCYGCGRCVPACPTDALSLLPFQVDGEIERMLAHPLVDAVEIHSKYADPLMLEAFLVRWQPLLAGKLVSLCFRPTEVEAIQWQAFVETAERLLPGDIMLQIDGAPMSGTDAPHASLPALQAAAGIHEWMDANYPWMAVTISGGINAHTADYLKRPDATFIAGVGMGTVARALIWDQLDTPDTLPAMASAASLVGQFRDRRNPV